MYGLVVDTNVLFRALVNEKGGDYKAYRFVFNNEFRFYYHESRVKEFLEILQYKRISKKYTLSEEVLDVFMSPIRKYGESLEPEVVKICRDIDDNEVLGLATAATRKSGKVFLITHDEDLLDLNGKIETVEILRPGEFLRDQVPTPLRLRLR